MNKYKELQQHIEDVFSQKLVVPEHTDITHYYRYMPTGEVYPSVTTKTGILDKSYLKNWSVKLAMDHIRSCYEVFHEDPELILNEAEHKHVSVLEDAGDIGTVIHEIIENYINTWIRNQERPFDIREFALRRDVNDPKGYIGNDNRVMAAIRSAEELLAQHPIIPLTTEVRVACPQNKLAGTVDLVCLVGNKQQDEMCLHNFMQSSRKHLRFECSKCGYNSGFKLGILDWKTSNQGNKPDYAMQIAAYQKGLAHMTGQRPKRLLVGHLYKESVKGKLYEVKESHSAFNAYKNAAQIYDWLNASEEKLEEVNKNNSISLI